LKAAGHLTAIGAGLGLLNLPSSHRIVASGQPIFGGKLIMVDRKIRFLTLPVVSIAAALATVCLLVVDQTQAQNINVTTPFVSSSDSYYENFGINFGFGFRGGSGPGSRVVGYGPQGRIFPNILFSNGGFGPPPVFGGYNPNAAARLGISRVGPNGGFSLGIVAGKGSTRTNITTAPSLTVQNGFGGSIASGQVAPFVTGVIPFVGNGSRQVVEPDNGVTRALRSGQLDLRTPTEPESYQPTGPVSYSTPDSTATQGDLSVRQIKAERHRKLEARRRAIEAILAEAAQLEEQKNYADARTAYRKALAQTDDESQRRQIKALIQATRSK
jgi:hypothetical protein